MNGKNVMDRKKDSELNMQSLTQVDQNADPGKNNKFEKIKETEKKVLTILNNRLQRYIEHVDTLEETNRALKSENRRLKNMTKKIETIPSASMTQVDSAIKTPLNGGMALETWQAQIEEVNKKNVSLRVERDGLRNDLQTTTQKLNEQKKENIDLEKQIYVLQREVRDSAIEKGHLNYKIGTHRETIKYLKKNYNNEWQKQLSEFGAWSEVRGQLQEEIARYQQLLRIADYRKAAMEGGKFVNVGDGESPAEWVFSFDPATDAITLRKALDRFNPDDDVIMTILTNRNRPQLQQVAQKYQEKYNEDLVSTLDDKLRGNFRLVCMHLIWRRSEIDSHAVRHAIMGIGTDEPVLIEVLCTSNKQEINKMKQTYSSIFKGRNLLNDVEMDTSGHFRDLLSAIVEGGRDAETGMVNVIQAQSDAKQLANLSSRDWSISNAFFFQVFTQRSFEHLRFMFMEAWPKLTDAKVLDLVDVRLRGDVRKCIRTIVRYVTTNSRTYNAIAIHESLTARNIQNRRLIYILTTLDDVVLTNVQTEYEKMYNKKLNEKIKEEVSGNYEKVLLAILRKTRQDLLVV